MFWLHEPVRRVATAAARRAGAISVTLTGSGPAPDPRSRRCSLRARDVGGGRTHQRRHHRGGQAPAGNRHPSLEEVAAHARSPRVAAVAGAYRRAHRRVALTVLVVMTLCGCGEITVQHGDRPDAP